MSPVFSRYAVWHQFPTGVTLLVSRPPISLAASGRVRGWCSPRGSGHSIGRRRSGSFRLPWARKLCFAAGPEKLQAEDKHLRAAWPGRTVRIALKKGHNERSVADDVLNWTDGAGVDTVVDDVGGSVFEDNLNQHRRIRGR